MNQSNSNSKMDKDVFILKRDQQQQPERRAGTPPPDYNLITITYEIIKTQDYHVVLVHEEAPAVTTNTESETGVIRRFTQDNPVIPEDTFVSPVRQFDREIYDDPDNNVDSPISFYSSSEGYYSGSDWETDSSWRSYNSLTDDLPTLFETPIRSISQFLLPEGTGYRSRGLSQPRLSCEHCSKHNPVFEKKNWEKNKKRGNRQLTNNQKQRR